MKAFAIPFLLFIPFFGTAQKVSPQVINQAGFDLLPSKILAITVSIGEPAIATFINDDFILTQGFLQPEIVPCGEFELTYYPNPTQDDVIVEALGCDIKIESMQLIDVWGRVLTTMSPAKDNKVYLGDVSPGVYFIRVFLTNTQTESIKIAKVSN
jgi:Secretion system C-terminal sorting domain